MYPARLVSNLWDHISRGWNVLLPLAAGFLALGIACGTSKAPLETLQETMPNTEECAFGQEGEDRAAQGQPLPPQGQTNLHANPGVEKNLDFHGQGTRALLERSDEWAYEGSYSVRVTVNRTSADVAVLPTTAPDGPVVIYYTMRGSLTSSQDAVKAAPDAEYTISATVKSRSCGELSIAAREFDDAGNILAYTISPGEIVSERPTWLALTFTTTPETTGFSTEVRSGPTAPLTKGFVYYYDNVQAWARR